MVALAALAAAGVPPPAQAQPAPGGEAPTEFTVVLQAPSVGERLRASKSDPEAGTQARSATTMDQMRRDVARGQDTVKAAIRAQGVEVLGSVSNVLNAIFVRATAEQAEALEGLAGVRAVVPGRRYEPLLKSVAEIVKASAAHLRPAGTELLGDGLKIAIIDSGLDFDHEAFTDPDLPPLEGYPRGDPEYLSLANTKVIAVRSYVESIVERGVDSSTPDDPSPADLGGHGTAVAMIAAGRRVDSPLGEIMGIAPKARIGVYKVFGSPGVNYRTYDHVVIAAIDDAVADGMDILNLSLGNPQTYPWNATGSACGKASVSAICNPLAHAAHSAVQDFGKVVVAAAGNEALTGTEAVPALSSLLSPGHTASVIAVGATENAVSRQVSVRVGEQVFESVSGTGPDADGALTAPAVLTSDLDNFRGCDPYDDEALSGRIAVIERGVCFFVDKVEHADAAGASGVLVINHEADALVTMALLEDTDIPAFFVGRVAGATIRRLLESPEAMLTLDARPVETEQEWEHVAAFSSRGPGLALHPKPDLVAPGDQVYAAAPFYNDEGVRYTPSGFREYSGTSFAAPVVAGAAALVWQAMPGLTARQVASVLINTASPLTLNDGTRAAVTSAGAGVLDIEAALRPNASAVPSSIAFGSVRGAAFPVRRRVQISNHRQGSQTFMLRVERGPQASTARVTVNGGDSYQFSLAAGRSETIEVGLAGAAPGPGSYEGRLVLESLSGQGALSIPYLYLVGDNRPANVIPISGLSAGGLSGLRATRTISARVLDQFGVPVANHPVFFRAMHPETRVLSSLRRSDEHGRITARVQYSATDQPQVVEVRIGSLVVPFDYVADQGRPEVVAISVTPISNRTSAVVAGSLATVTGSGFAPHSSGAPETPQMRPFPLTRKGASVALDSVSDDISIAAPIFSVTPDSVTFQVPWELAGKGGAYLKVRNGRASEPFLIALSPTRPAVFNYEHNGRPYAVAYFQDGSRVTRINPAIAGDLVTILMTGNGPVVSQPPSGSPPDHSSETVAKPDVWLAGRPARVVHSGLDPELAGLYLLTFEVPSRVPTRLPWLRVRMSFSDSNATVLPYF